VALLLPFWGVSIRNYGIRPNARIMSLLLLYIPLAWLWASPDSWRAMLVLNGLASGIAAAFDICNIQFMTRSCPQLSRPTLIAVFGIVAGTTVAVANWAGGAIAQCLDDFHWDYQGHHFCNYHVLIAASFLMRLFTAFVLAPRIEEPEATPTREAVRETVATLYQAFAVRFTRLSAARDE
jgi:MFS family permease